MSSDMRPLYEALEKTTKPQFVASKNSIAARQTADRDDHRAATVTAPAQKRVEIAIDPEFAASIPAAKKKPVPPPTQTKQQVEISPPRQAQPKKKKAADPSYDEHNYSYGEETNDDNHDDPYMKAADKEFKQAQRAFEIAQKAKADAQKKQDDRIKKQQEDIEKA